ncbi:MAG: adenosylhomocysteinase [Bacillota bacterium]|nr:adenosylhomocysteinase [Bacillota bacterium]
MSERFVIRDPALAPEGRQRILWARRHMPVLNRIREEFTASLPLRGRKIAISVHLEAKTACLALTLRDAGAEVAVTGSNPLSTQDPVAAALVEEGLRVYAWHGATEEEYRRHLNLTLDFGPDLVIDDGGDLVHLLHTARQDLLPGVRGGTEETTTGVLRLRAREREGALRFPMVAVNDAYSKYLFDNRYGTGQSTWDGIMRTTNLLVAGKVVVVAGYGWCGRGIAARAAGLGARVVVCEVDPIRALEAAMDGYQVLPMREAARVGDIFVTATGCRDVVRGEHFDLMKDGAVLANAGHFNVEINLPELAARAVERRPARQNVEEFVLSDGRRLYLLGEGRLVNLACGDGHPIEIMDLSFALQALAIQYVDQHAGELAPGVHRVPAELDRRVAELKLASLGVEIDRLSEEQQEYLASWGE